MISLAREPIFVALAVAMAGLTACGPAEPVSGTAGARGAAGWSTPPTLLQVAADAGGVVVLGQANPEARVRAMNVDGATFGATADRNGRYAIQIPGSAPRLLSVAAEDDGRFAAIDGVLFVPPSAPQAAALLRPGDGARPVQSDASFRLTAVDYDQAGGVAVSGQAPAGQPVEVWLDGALAAQGAADSAGRFALPLAARVGPGPHTFRIVSGEARRERTVTLTPPETVQAFVAEPEVGGWRVKWPLPGGGSQSTILIGAGD